MVKIVKTFSWKDFFKIETQPTEYKITPYQVRL